ncbi:unnamed protein product [Aphanomyces euteiches]
MKGEMRSAALGGLRTSRYSSRRWKLKENDEGSNSKTRLDINRVSRVAISRQGCIRDLLLHPDMPLDELRDCLRAIFPQVETPIALKNEHNTLYPLSLLANHPSTFTYARKESHVPLELVCLGDPDVSYTELTRQARVGWQEEEAPMELTQYTLPQLIREFGKAAPTGALDRTSFIKCLTQIMAREDQELFSRLFDIFDKDRNGVVDVVEFVSGLSVIVQGDRDEKIRATFSLYDTNGDGFISLEEMTTYLTSVYLVVAELNPSVFASNHVDPIQLGQITAEQCFAEADLNHDGRLSFEEFRTWYTRSHHHEPHARKLKHAVHCQVPVSSPPTVQVKWTLNAVRDMTGLGDYSVDEMLACFPHTTITKATFLSTMQRILQRQRKPVTSDVRALLNTLFSLFDSDGNGVLNGVELQTGLSVLCRPSPYSVRAAFNLIDANHDGHISMNEMVRYLSSVFRVLHGVTNTHVPLDPDTLARHTALQMFAEVDLNRDGSISFDEFQVWYSTPTTVHPTTAPLFPGHRDMANLTQVSQPMTLERAGALTTLNSRHPLDVFEVVALYVNSDGVLTKEAFNQAFTHLMQGALNDQSRTVIEKLFHAFDADGDGVVDFCELSSGLSLLCAGSQQEKIEAAFTLYDVNKDNFISMAELVSYLTAVFRVVYAFGTPVPNVTPEQLAETTAADAFALYDANNDGQLSLEEFTAWYTSPQPSAPPAPVAPGGQPQFDLAFLRQARQLTHLGQYAVNDIFSFFQASSTSDGLSKAQFFRCFNKLLSKTAPAAETKPQLKATLERLFVLFDTDGNGIVDTKELAAGLSLLCGGSDVDKVQAAFSLFDTNGDGFISREEMLSYLTAVFKVLLQTSPNIQTQLGHASAVQLAQATTEHCFATCDVNHDNQLSIDEFTKWYRAPQVKKPKTKSRPQAKQSQSLPQARALLGLMHVSSDALMDLFRDRLDHPVSEKAFFACVSKLVQTEDATQKARVHVLISKLFQSFHAAFQHMTPGLLYLDVACGLSVLASDAHQDKVLSTFRLMDRNGDMVLTETELVRYFTAVFAIMYVLEPEKLEAVQSISPYELAKITAENTLAEADRNHDNEISFVEFQRWYTKDQPPPPTLAEIRHLTGLGYLNVEDVFERLADTADEKRGGVSFEAFLTALTDVAQEHHGPEVPSELEAVGRKLFQAFDADPNGRVDFSELAAGLSVLCKGTREAKVHAAFSLYDFNGDGFITMDEMTRYLTSVFRVLYVLQPHMALETGVSATELGTITAEQAFVDADLDRDNRLSLNEFAQWYAKHKSPIITPTKKWNLNEIRRLTKLMYHKAEDVFELFAEAANEDGNLDQASFNKCFMTLMNDNNPWIKPFLGRLFALFDANHDGLVDFSELTAGLSILCAGSKEDKVQAAFSLFDFNGDGYISLEEMTKYLTSVFRVLFEVNDEHAQTLQVSPEELAIVTAKQAFNEVDLNHDGKIGLDEFMKWYSNPGSLASHTEHLFSLQEARRLTQLERYAPDTVFELLADCADTKGNLTKEAFTECFETNFISKPDARSMHVIHRLFDIFDVDGNGTVDFAELTAGLSVLCGGRREDKVRAAFALYDYNHDGVISLDEMTRYLTAVFKVLYSTNPGLEAQMQVTPAELAQVTAEQAFLECDINQDGKLTLDEFHAWYTQSHKTQKVSIPLPSLAQVRHLTNLSSYPPDEVVERFRQAATNSGQFSLEEFTGILKSFAKDGEDPDALDSVAARLYELFDTDGNGVVDYTEFGAGLSVLCGGTQEDKIRAAFALYDLNHDGTISRSEMALYLTSVFKVLYETNPDTEQRVQGVTPEELGIITAEQAFVEADKDHNGVLSFDEFRQWYLTPSESRVNTIQVPSWVSLQAVKELTQLHLYSPSYVFQLLSEHMTDPKGLDRASFERCFASLIPTIRDPEARHRIHLILDRLFNVFDTNGNGYVNYQELASGLSILCGGSRDEKVRAAFDLYDLNHDGVLSLDEMVQYLTAVFKILCETNTQVYPDDVTPEELAQITAEECFAQAQVPVDGKLNYNQFERWYTRDTPATNEESASSMDRIRNLLKLNKYEVGDIFEIFAEAAPNGELGFAAFRQCFEHMIDLAGGYDSPQAKQEAAVVIRRLFLAFDVNHNNAVDFGELASGLSVLSGSTMDDKVLAAFRLYDVNSDGYISLDEMISYMTSIFRVMYETSDKTKGQMSVSPEELARVTATQCFKDADRNQDKKLSFEEFKQWCTSTM